MPTQWIRAWCFTISYLTLCCCIPSQTESHALILPSHRPFFAPAEAAGADLSALAYVRRMRRMNLAGSRAAAAPAPPAGGAADGLAASWGLNWADKTFGQGLSSLTKGALFPPGLLLQQGACISASGQHACSSCVPGFCWSNGHTGSELMLKWLCGCEEPAGGAAAGRGHHRRVMRLRSTENSITSEECRYSYPGVNNLLAAEQQVAVTVADGPKLLHIPAISGLKNATDCTQMLAQA